MLDPEFTPHARELHRAVELLRANLRRRRLRSVQTDPTPLPAWVPSHLPEDGVGSARTLARLAPLVVGRATPLDDPGMLAHMDPPAPWVAWAATLWSAALNQNLLHPDLAPVAGPVETRVVRWLAPAFGMTGGHLVPGSTVANLTALWAARELRRVREVVASSAAHLSVRKSADLLGLRYREVRAGPDHRIVGPLPGDLSRSAVVLTAGTTVAGAIDDLTDRPAAAWVHVDAAWAGPLRLTDRYRKRLAGIERADSVGFSGHKWMFQPKESAVVLFRDDRPVRRALARPADYLSAPNVGLLGSHGAVAVPLFATLLAWGRRGLARRVERCMDVAERLAARVAETPELELWGAPTAGVVLWKHRRLDAARVVHRLRGAYLATIRVNGRSWLRSAIANPMADPDRAVQAVLDSVARRGSGARRSARPGR